MPDTPTPDSESNFVCDCEEWMRSACAGESFYKEHQRKSYCVLHFPGPEKRARFKDALQRKLDNFDFNFRGVWFPDELSYSKFHFKGDCDFGEPSSVQTQNSLLLLLTGALIFSRPLSLARFRLLML